MGQDLRKYRTLTNEDLNQEPYINYKYVAMKNTGVAAVMVNGTLYEPNTDWTPNLGKPLSLNDTYITIKG